MRYREEDVLHITKDFFGGDDPKIYFTKGGSIAAIFSDKGGGNKPLLGAYFTGDEWLAAQWDSDGYFIAGGEHTRKMDLIMNSANSPEVA